MSVRVPQQSTMAFLQVGRTIPEGPAQFGVSLNLRPHLYQGIGGLMILGLGTTVSEPLYYVTLCAWSAIHSHRVRVQLRTHGLSMFVMPDAGHL